MRDKILIVDDEPDITNLLAEILKGAGFDTYQASDGEIAWKEFFRIQPDLIIIDIVMPLMDGYTLCRRIREVSNAPIIIISARAEPTSVVRGIEIGADDYLIKPFTINEVVARVRGALRRYRLPPPSVVKQYSDAVLFIDFQKRDIRINDHQIQLTPAEFTLLTALVQNRDKTLTWQEIFEILELEEDDAYDIVKWHIYSLRRKIEKETGIPELITNIRGVGYRYVPQNPEVT